MPWAMAPTSPVKGCCTRYDVRKAKSSAVLFWVRAFCSLLGAEIERVRCRLLRTLVNSIRVLLIIIVPLPSPSVISWVIYLCEGAEGWCESCDAHNSVSIFWTIVAFRKEYFSLIVQLFWRNFLYFSSTKAFFFFLGMLILSLTFRSFQFCPTMWFSTSLHFDSHLQTPGKPDGVTWIWPGDPCIWKDPCWVPCWVASVCIRTSPSGATRKGEAKISILVKSKHLH